MTDTRLAAGLIIESAMRDMTSRGVSHYVLQKGAYFSGTLLLKIATLDRYCRLLTRQRDFDGVTTWTDVLKDETPSETDADEYIRRAIARDPDLWVIEVEDRTGQNPFVE